MVPVPQRRQPGPGPGRCSGRTGHRLSTTRGPKCSTRSASPRAHGPPGRAPTSGFSGLHVTTDTVARPGLALPQGGVWEGRQVLLMGWVATASSALADTWPTTRAPPTERSATATGVALPPRLPGRRGLRPVRPGPAALTTSSSPPPRAPRPPRRSSTPSGTSLLPTLGEPPLPADPGRRNGSGGPGEATGHHDRSTATPPRPARPWTPTHVTEPRAPGSPRSAVGSRPEAGWLLDRRRRRCTRALR